MATAFIARLIAICLASLRLGPMLVFSPPFSLVRMPAPARLIIAIGLASAIPISTVDAHALVSQQMVILIGLHEVAMGVMLMLALQLAFATIAMAGRALDIQAGFGLASVIDPTTKAEMPLIETIVTYAAAAVFFTTSAPDDLYAILVDSFSRYPMSADIAPLATGGLLDFLSAICVLSIGLIGLALLILLLIDLAVALISRTLPQMNVLVLGFQIKAMAALALLPIVIGGSGAGILKILRLAIDNTPPPG